ncbi:MAG: peptidoglycan DD-metalloendopeptidase family protein [Thermodesulfobacteriota bacterium]
MKRAFFGSRFPVANSALRTALLRIVPALLLAALLVFTGGCLHRGGVREVKTDLDSGERSSMGRSFAGPGHVMKPQVPTASQPSGKLIWPVHGRIVSRFGTHNRAEQNGILISAENAAPVRAAADGKVGYVGSIKGYGNVVLIEHADRLVTVYAHLDGPSVEKGAPVKKGQAIGTVENSGRSGRADLYFEVRSRSKPVDPLPLLEKAG